MENDLKAQLAKLSCFLMMSIKKLNLNVIIDKHDCVHVIYRADFTENQMTALTLSPKNYCYADAVERILGHESLGFAEPIIDRMRWQKDRVLSIPSVIMILSESQTLQGSTVKNDSIALLVILSSKRL